MIQIICGFILVLIGILVFWKFPIKSDTKSLTLAALFIVLAAVLKRWRSTEGRDKFDWI